jgi:hypothetical protein
MDSNPSVPSREETLILDQYDDTMDIDWWFSGNPGLMERQFRDESLKHFRRYFTGCPQQMLGDQEDREVSAQRALRLQQERLQRGRERLKGTDALRLRRGPSGGSRR